MTTRKLHATPPQEITASVTKRRHRVAKASATRPDVDHEEIKNDVPPTSPDTPPTFTHHCLRASERLHQQVAVLSDLSGGNIIKFGSQN